MKLIISEKSIAGKTIAEVLSNKSERVSVDGGVNTFSFSFKDEDYLVVPLSGHITDLDFPKKYSYWIGVDLKKLVEAEIEYQPSAVSIVNALKRKAKIANETIIATDADREGESIGKEAIAYLKESNPKMKFKRAYFSAITKKDMEESFSNLKEFDYDLADSADARREIDLIWGAVLTRFLSLVSGRMGKEFLSAGRVQIPTLKLIVEREKARQVFKIEKFFVLEAELEKDGIKFQAEHKTGRFSEKGTAEEIQKKLGKKGIVNKKMKKEKTLQKPIPFNTTEFLRAASAMGFSASKAMSVAESLYMSGLTSYPRTDNQCYPKNLDLKEILVELSKVNELEDFAKRLLAKNELNPSRGKETKDHPPIHPVLAASRSKLDDEKWKIYQLISRRFLATLSDNALVDMTKAEILIANEPFIANGQVFIKKGWKECYPYSKLNEFTLPSLEKGDECQVNKVDLVSGETKPPARFSHGTLIALMDELNLGTKATRAEMINKLQQRQYITGIKQLEPQNVAFAVIDNLSKYAIDLTEPVMTAELEQEMDLISVGKKSKDEVVKDARDKLLKILEVLLKDKNQIGSEIRNGLKKDLIVGPCTKDDGKLIIRFGKTGKRFLGCTNYPKCTQTFPLPQKGKLIPINENCLICKAPMIQLFGKRFRLKFCVNMDCASKDEWKKKQNEKKEAMDKVAVENKNAHEVEKNGIKVKKEPMVKKGHKAIQIKKTAVKKKIENNV